MQNFHTDLISSRPATEAVSARIVELACAKGHDILVFSDFRWNSSLTDPEHLFTRFANHNRVFFFEEPDFDPNHLQIPKLEVRRRDNGVLVVTPCLPSGLKADQITELQAALLEQLVYEKNISDYVVWYCTPKALEFTQHLNADAVVSDFDGIETPAQIPQADLVFVKTSEHRDELSLHHDNVHTHATFEGIANLLKATLYRLRTGLNQAS